MNDRFTKIKLDRALAGCKDKSSPGLAQIEYKMIKCLPLYLKKCLLNRFNYAYSNSFLYDDWKRIQTIFIAKKNKKKVRPISMSSSVGKVLERMVNERLIWMAEREGWLDRNQNGFRRGYKFRV